MPNVSVPVVSSLSELVGDADESNLLMFVPTTGGFGANSAINGFSYRHDWGNRTGMWRLTLNIQGVTCNSRVWVAATEFGGGGQCGFVGDAVYTVHNVATANGQIIVRVNVGWPNPLRLRLDYLVVNP